MSYWLYSLPSQELPLNGLRIAIKDKIHLASLPTCLSSPALEQLDQKAKRSAGYVQILTNLGAVVVGKTKLS